MTIAISYSIKSLVPSFASVANNVLFIDENSTLEDITNNLVSEGYECDVKLNYADQPLDTVLKQADHISVEVLSVIAPEAAPVAYGATVHVPPVAQNYGASISFVFLNADSTGFASNKTVPAGTSLAHFIVTAGYTDLARWVIRVNNEPVAADYVLKQGDKVAMFPSKVEGAVDMIKVLFIDARANSGGFAPQRDAIAGITIKQFLQQQLQTGDVGGMIIRVNNNPVVDSYVLQNGDKVSLFPSKVEGAV
jgi:molybdopterin converting factor small subunit